MSDNQMTPEMASRMALHLCMQGVARYLDCLNGVVNTYGPLLPPEFVAEVKRDFEEYARRMTEAGLPFKRIERLGE